LIAPKEKEHKGERTGSKISFTHQLVKNFQKIYVLTLTVEDMMEEALRLIMDKKIGSVVIVDENKRPIGIITTRDFLNLIMYHKNKEILEVVSRDLSQENRQILGGFFNQISLSVKKIPDIVNARLFVKEEKQEEYLRLTFRFFPKKVVRR
jgi:CBS domain-containing protein